MATAKDFLKLGEIEGVARFILLRRDGSKVSGNFDDDESLTSAIISAGIICESFSEDLDGRRFLHLCIERENGENIFIFSLGSFFLGIMKYPDTDPAALPLSVLNFLKALS